MPEDVRVPSTAGVQIGVNDCGGEGPPLLFLAANGFHGRCYAPMAAELAGRFRCVLVDLQGQGASPEGSARGNMLEHHATDCLAVVSALQLRGCLAFGHSGGGLAVAIAEARCPGTFAAMYLYEPVLLKGGDRGNSRRMQQLALRRRRRFASREAALASFAGKPPFSSFQPDVLRAYVFHGLRDAPDGGCELACSPEAEARVYGNVRVAADALPEHRVLCPITVAAGTGADGAFERAAPLIAQRLPRARFERFQGLGHLGPMQDPARVAARVAAALHAARDAAAWAALPRSLTLGLPDRDKEESVTKPQSRL